MNKSRRLQTPAIPDSQLFDIPDGYTKTLKGEPFLCVDKFIKRKTRILLFASREQLKLLFESSIIFMDGTFSATPSIFEQVYCLHAIKHQQCKCNCILLKKKLLVSLFIGFVCVFGLLPDKKKSTYRFLFHELRTIATEMNMNFNPVTIMTDFEPALVEVLASEVRATFFFYFDRRRHIFFV